MNNEHVITDWLSPDEKYCIFLDELYDLSEKKLIGNIWENFEHFKFFIRYSTSVSDVSQEIKESIYGTLNNFVLTESVNEKILKNKNILAQLVNEGLFGDFVDWAKETGQSTVDGLRDFASTVGRGAEQIFNAISDFDLKEIFNLIAKGAIYILKKLRDALYHPVGMILDAILVATGIGKAVQWIPWALVVGLDIYEIFSGDYEEPLPLKILFTLFDVLAMVTTGAVAKGLRITFKGITKVDDIARLANRNPKVRQFFQKIPEYLKKISPMMERAINYLKNRFPKGANFLKNTILPKIDGFINKVIETFGKLFSKKAAVVGATTTGVVFGLDQLIKKIFSPGDIELTPEQIENLSLDDDIDMDMW